MSDIAIVVENLGKRFLVGHQSAQRERYTALRDVIARNAREFWRKTRDVLRGGQIIQGDEIEEFWALRNVSFQVMAGEVVGIIGRNGAGKSTLLKILSRITEPTEGRVSLRGRVASLLEVGTGFHPELTGRENIFLNGAVLGMRRTEIARKFDEIVAFAEVEQFLDTPVKRYSSGMYVRLAFAVAAHLEPEILVVDEVLAVGDAQFQKKCLSKMHDVSTSQGRTVLLVSHNMASISQLCARTLLLRDGVLVMDGKTDMVINQYYQDSSCRDNRRLDGLAQATFNVNCKAPMRLIGIRVKDANGALLQTDVPYEGAMHVEIDYEVVRPDPEAYVVCCFTDSTGVNAWWHYDADTSEFGHRRRGTFRASIELPPCFFRAGRYFVRPGIVRLGGDAIDYQGAPINILVDDRSSALARKGVQWPSIVRGNINWRTRIIEAA